MKLFKKQKGDSFLGPTIIDDLYKLKEFDNFMSKSKPMDIESKTEYQKAIEVLDQKEYQLAKQINHDGLSDMYFFNNKDKTFVILKDVKENDTIFYFQVSLSFMAKPTIYSLEAHQRINEDIDEYEVNSLHGLFESYYSFPYRFDENFEINITPDMFAKMKGCFPIVNYMMPQDEIGIENFYYLQEKYSGLIDNIFPDRLENTINLLLMRYDKDITEGNCDIYRLLNDDVYFKEKLLHESHCANNLDIINVALSYIQAPDNAKDYIYELLGMQNKVEHSGSVLSEEDARNIISRLNYPDITKLDINVPWQLKSYDLINLELT